MKCWPGVNLTGVNREFPAELSAGMKKRVATGKAIVVNPKYLFRDEPIRASILNSLSSITDPKSRESTSHVGTPK